MTYNYFIEVYDFPLKRKVWFKGYPPNYTITEDVPREAVAIFKVKWKDNSYLHSKVILHGKVYQSGLPGRIELQEMYY